MIHLLLLGNVEVTADGAGKLQAPLRHSKRVALLANERSRSVKFQIDAGEVTVTSNSSEFGEAKEVIPVEYSGPSVTICFNAQYVLDFLAVAETEVVVLQFKDEMSQAVMKPVGASGYDYTYVIMPMRI